MALEKNLLPHELIGADDYWDQTVKRHPVISPIADARDIVAKHLGKRSLMADLRSRYQWLNAADGAHGVQEIPAGSRLPMLDAADPTMIRIVNDRRINRIGFPGELTERLISSGYFDTEEFDRRAPLMLADSFYSDDSIQFYEPELTASFKRSVLYFCGSASGRQLTGLGSCDIATTAISEVDIYLCHAITVGTIYGNRGARSRVVEKVVRAELLWPQ